MLNIPELGLGTDLIGGPELHSVNLGMLIGFGWKSSPDNLVLMELFPQNKIAIITYHIFTKCTRIQLEN